MIARYKHKQYDNGEFITLYSPVEIIRNDNKTYLVKCLDYCRGHNPGETIRVNKKSLKF